MASTTRGNGTAEVAILARMLGGGAEKLPPAVARHIVSLRPTPRDKSRMHDLATRNQEGALTPAERDELFAYTKAGTVVSILKSKARRALGFKPTKRPAR